MDKISKYTWNIQEQFKNLQKKISKNQKLLFEFRLSFILHRTKTIHYIGLKIVKCISISNTANMPYNKKKNEGCF